jgi:hypothetical protein
VTRLLGDPPPVVLAPSPTPAATATITPPLRRAPIAKIRKHPRARVRSRARRVRVSFTLTADQPGAVFECRIDKAKFKPCTSKVRLRVKRGAHHFQVRARNANGLGPVASFRFRVLKRHK